MLKGNKIRKEILALLLTVCLAVCAACHVEQTPSATGITGTSDLDGDGDGFPDAAELIDETDRARFRQWFTAIAESQFYALHPDWPEIRRDCTGLICFAYKEALKTHDDNWLKSFKYLTNPAVADIKTYRYPHIPLLGTAIFRTATGPFREQDLKNNVFQPVTTARVAMEYNCRFMGKELDDTILEGDLLFYRYYINERTAFHAMILVKKDAGDGLVVYHTGPDGKQSGEVRKLRISTLNRHPDDLWHVKPNNPYFLGFYRFHILEYRYLN